jgi:hypothetical protein
MVGQDKRDAFGLQRRTIPSAVPEGDSVFHASNVNGKDY